MWPFSRARPPRALASSAWLRFSSCRPGAMNRFRLTGASPVTASAALATCSLIPCSVRRSAL